MRQTRISSPAQGGDFGSIDTMSLCVFRSHVRPLTHPSSHPTHHTQVHWHKKLKDKSRCGVSVK